MGQSDASWGPGCPTGATVPISAYSFDGKGGPTSFGQIATELQPMLDILLAETERRGYIIGKGAHDDWGYANRFIDGTTTPSNHSRATAIDVNSRENGYGVANPAFPDKIAHEVWESCGWEWGGDWSMPGRDGMHLEYLPARSTVKANTEKARRAFGDPKEEEMLDDYIAGEVAYREKFKELGKDPGEPVSNKPAYFKRGWASARFAASNPANGTGTSTTGPIPNHLHRLKTDTTGPSVLS